MMQISSSNWGILFHTALTVSLLVGCGTTSNQATDAKSREDTSSVESEETSSLTLDACETLDIDDDYQGIKVEADIDGQASEFECLANDPKLTLTALPASADPKKGTYQHVCDHLEDDETYLSLWVSGFEIDEPFTTQMPYGTKLPNTTFKYTSPEGELVQDSFTIDDANVDFYVAVVRGLDDAGTTSDGTALQRLTGCVEGRFSKAGRRSAGTLKIQFRNHFEAPHSLDNR